MRHSDAKVALMRKVAGETREYFQHTSPLQLYNVLQLLWNPVATGHSYTAYPEGFSLQTSVDDAVVIL